MKKVRNCKPGSAILIVILIMSAVIFASFNLWKGTALTMDLVLKRQEHAQRAKIVEGVLNYGISLCMDRFDSFVLLSKKGQKTVELEVGTWSLESHPPYKGHLYIEIADSRVKMSASLVTNQACSCGASCIVERITTGKENKVRHTFKIHDWFINA